MGNYIYYGYYGHASRSTVTVEPTIKRDTGVSTVHSCSKTAVASEVVEEVKEVVEEVKEEVKEVVEEEKEEEKEEKEKEVHPYLLEYGTAAIVSNTVVIQQETYQIRKRKNRKEQI